MEFYKTLCIKEAYSSRELEHQIENGYYERYMLSKGIASRTNKGIERE
ncbi:hypothetical protein [Ruminococcus sp. 5_1_39BFAA]